MHPMPASSWCHMWLALGCAAQWSGLRHGVPAVLRACATALKLRKCSSLARREVSLRDMHTMPPDMYGKGPAACGQEA